MDFGLGNDCHFQPLCLVDKRHRCLASQNLWKNMGVVGVLDLKSRPQASKKAFLLEINNFCLDF